MNNFKSGKSVSVLASAALLASTFAWQTSYAEQESMLEEVVVTGSRIKRDTFSSPSPISVYDTQDVSLSGVASVDEFLKDIPAFTGYQMGTSTNNGSDQGQKKIDMRGLGFERTLVLVNGRRMIGDANDDGAVDLNAIPEAMIKRIEILKDGASTIYGSDALSGVVNFILNDDFEGVEVTAGMGQGTEDNQAENNSLSLLAGVGGERGNLVMSMSYNNQDEMKQDERPYAIEALYSLLQANGGFQLTGSGSSNSRKIRVPGQGNWILDADTGRARAFESGDVYNYSAVNALVTPNERWQFGAIGKVEIAPMAEAYAEGIYTRRTSHQRLAPDASFAVTPTFDTPNNGAQWNDWVPASNPFNPFGVNASGPDGVIGTGDDLNPLGIENSDVRINRRFVESGGRIFRQTNDTYRLVAGLRGEAYNIDWDVSYIYAETETLDETLNYGRFDRWATAVDPVACAADAACPGTLNPFGDFGSITGAQMAYLSTGSLKDLYSSRLEMVSINLSGEGPEMGGGAFGWAAGVERRRETGFFSPDEFLAGGLTTGGASDPQSGQFSVDEIFGEIFLPITDRFNADASLRYSKYDTISDNSTTYKLGAEYQAMDDLRLRATFSTGFRAPNITELNQGDTSDFPIIVSVCEFADRALASGGIPQTTYDNCQALGVDTTDAGEHGFAWQSLYTTSAPTAALKPEESETLTLGLIYEPSQLDGLQVSLDYWDITIEDVIGEPDMNDLYRTCLASTNLSSRACSAFDDAGGPHNTADYDIFPTDAVSQFGNLGTLKTDGWDFEAQYRGAISNSVVLGYEVSWSATFQNSYDREYPLTGAISLVGTANGFEVFPEWRWQFGAGIYGENWTADYRMRFIGETKDRLRPAAVTADAVAEDIMYHDLVGTYNWNNLSFMLGINNLTDEVPPYFHSAFNANTEPGTYDVIGRRMFLSVKASF
jgi:iron complex outermembrane receptor protein